MFMLGRKLPGLLLLVLVAAMPLGCGESHERSRDVTVGGEHGVVVERSDSGTEVRVGGEHGVVVDHPRD